MIKFVGAAIWVCIATLAAVYFSFQMSAPPPPDGKKEATMLGGLDYVKTEVISVPLIREGSIVGYFLSRLVYTVDPKEMAKLTIPAESLITDVVYAYVYSNPKLDFSKTAELDLAGFKSGVRDAINERVKYDLVKDVLIEQIDYLSKDEIRDNALRRRQVVTSKVPVMKTEGEGHGDAHGEAAPAEAAPASH